MGSGLPGAVSPPLAGHGAPSRGEVREVVVHRGGGGGGGLEVWAGGAEACARPRGVRGGDATGGRARRRVRARRRERCEESGDEEDAAGHRSRGRARRGRPGRDAKRPTKRGASVVIIPTSSPPARAFHRGHERRFLGRDTRGGADGSAGASAGLRGVGGGAAAHAPSRVTAATPLRFDADASGPAAARAFAARWASARLVWMNPGVARDPSSPDDTARRVAAAVAAHAAGEFCGRARASATPPRARAPSSPPRRSSPSSPTPEPPPT